MGRLKEVLHTSIQEGINEGAKVTDTAQQELSDTLESQKMLIGGLDLIDDDDPEEAENAIREAQGIPDRIKKSCTMESPVVYSNVPNALSKCAEEFRK
ncbi:MAG: hypothetical protein K2J32_07220 [Ruminococcus sp.]|nr:hypothetical protein [Ruminococcus sp.]